jgi:hypothetical protein
MQSLDQLGKSVPGPRPLTQARQTGLVDVDHPNRDVHLLARGPALVLIEDGIAEQTHRGSIGDDQGKTEERHRQGKCQTDPARGFGG